MFFFALDKGEQHDAPESGILTLSFSHSFDKNSG